VQTLKLRQDCPTDTVCFHAQQCVEKYLKAMLVMRQIGFTRTHDLRILMQLVPPTIGVDLDTAEQDRLTRFAVATRYPGEEEPISLAEARQAVRVAKRVRRDVRRLLPIAALRKAKPPLRKQRK
jgi:HEPN domain-containing protein